MALDCGLVFQVTWVTSGLGCVLYVQVCFIRRVVAAGFLGMRWTLTLHGDRLVPLIDSANSLFLTQTQLAKHLGQRSSVEHESVLIFGAEHLVVLG